MSDLGIWDEGRVKRLIDHYENMSDDQMIAEDEAARDNHLPLGSQLLDLNEYSLVWGPLVLPEPAFSFDDDWISEVYTPQEIADSILAVPGAKIREIQAGTNGGRSGTTVGDTSNLT